MNILVGGTSRSLYPVYTLCTDTHVHLSIYPAMGGYRSLFWLMLVKLPLAPPKTHTYSQTTASSPPNLTCTTLDCGKEVERPRVNTQYQCRKHQGSTQDLPAVPPRGGDVTGLLLRPCRLLMNFVGKLLAAL